MPCRDEWNSGGVRYVTDPETKRRLDLATRVACTALSQLEDVGSGRIKLLPVESQEWWHQHKRADRKRQAHEEAVRRREQIKNRALAKLTPEERRVLDI
jgi:hypothetical protein